MSSKRCWWGAHVAQACQAIALVAIFAVFSSAKAAQPVPSDHLFEDAAMPSSLRATTERTVLRTRAVQVRMEMLGQLSRAGGDALIIPLFDDETVTAVFERFTLREQNRFTWTGTLAEDHDGGWFIVSVFGNVMVANFWLADGTVYEVRPVGADGDVYLLREIDQQALPECKTCQNQHVAQPPDEGQPMTVESGPVPCGEDDGSLIDVLVVYTPAARNAAGGDNAILALIDAAIESTNTAYFNSVVDTRVRLVHAALTNYAESGSFNTDLNRLRGQNNGHMDEVHDLRDQYGADLVALINHASGSCGIAYVMTNLSTAFASSAFSITRVGCAVSNLTFAHELGHNMGCAHDHENAGNALFDYSYGHRWVTTSGVTRRSVLAYAPGIRVPHFSNPVVLSGGTPTGVPPGERNAAHNALSINNAAYTVSNFRHSICDQPENDLCVDAVVVGEGVFPFQTFGASTDGPAESGCDLTADVWFRHIPQCTGTLTISLCGSSFNTSLVVYDLACPDDGGAVLACNSNWCGEQSEIELAAVQGEEVLIRVGGANEQRGEGALTIFCTPAQQPCPADLTGSGVVGVSDLLELLGAWGPCPDCPQDITGDGVVDVSDLLELLGAWGPCPGDS